MLFCVCSIGCCTASSPGVTHQICFITANVLAFWKKSRRYDAVLGITGADKGHRQLGYGQPSLQPQQDRWVHGGLRAPNP